MEITRQTPIGEIVRNNLRAASVFEKYNIDYCCGGEQSLGNACESSNVDLGELLQEIESIVQTDDWDSKYLDGLPLDELCDYIVERHHAYINETAPFIEKNLAKLQEVHGEHHPEIRQVRSLFHEACGQLGPHMKKEELFLFPYIKKMVRFKSEGINKPDEFGNIRNLIELLSGEHLVEGNRFEHISGLTGNFNTPADGCATFKLTYLTLKEFKEDLHRHIHLENNVLFKKAANLEKELIL